ANLYGADLRSANLRSANLRSANLRSANLYGADLRSANLRSANLRSANLRSANLYGADLRSANLRSANLKETKGSELAIAQTRILPEGDLIGWKKCRDDVIVKLRIPEAARRSHAFGRKCRAEYADCIEVIGAEKGISSRDGNTEYVAGRRITPDAFDGNWQTECASGVHFFITRAEAEAY
ncbi:pentapeptide repeat-containing protein, partial [Corticibacterium sp. UT-5YL-CI-8]|nr:pentapeptide repeat-containing protein [Tianweitania sp. UT-5YL-CI-8]